MKKFVRRNTAPVAAAAAVLLALLAGLAGTRWQADEARREARRANTDASAARIAESEQRRLAESESKDRKVADAKTAEAELERIKAVRYAETIEYNSYVANMEMAAASMEFRQFDRVPRRLDASAPRLRGWEWGWIDACADNSLAKLVRNTDGAWPKFLSPMGVDSSARQTTRRRGCGIQLPAPDSLISRDTPTRLKALR